MRRTRTFALLLCSTGVITHAGLARADHGQCSPPNGESHLFLYPTGSIPAGTASSDCKSPACSPYVLASGDPWLQDSWVLNNDSALSMTIENRASTNLSSVYLLIAIRGATTNAQLQSVTIGGGAGGSVTLPFSAFQAHRPDDENPFVGSGSHGVYEPSGDALYAFYDVGAIVAREQAAVVGGTVQLTITALTNGDPNLQIHFDAFDCATGVDNAFSSDLTWTGPGCQLTIACPAPATTECNSGAGANTLGTPAVTNTCEDPATVTGPGSTATFAFSCDAASAAHPVTYTAVAGPHTASCNTSITVVDTAAPSASCTPAATIRTSEQAGSCSASLAVAASGTDACLGALDGTCSTAALSLTGPGTGSASCTVADCSNNRATCTTSLTLIDDTAPSVACPAPITVSLDAQCAASANVAATGTDNCGGDVTTACTPSAPSFSAPGTVAASCTATDRSGNSASCQTTVTAVDGTPPAISCPPSQTLECAGPCATQAIVAATATDNCSVASVSCAPGSGGYCLGSTINTCTAVDGSSNASSCTTTVHVVDTTPPAISCSGSRSVKTSEIGGACAYDLPVSATATDLCAGELAASCTPALLSLSGPGSASSECSASDGSGHTSACSVSVTLADDTRPAIACLGPTTVVADAQCRGVAEITGSAQDNCDGPLASTCTPSTLVFDGLGAPQSASCSTADGAGNAASCTKTVTLVDQTGPSVTLGATTGEAGGTGFCNDTPVGFAVSVSDNCQSAACPIQVSVSASSGSASYDPATGRVTVDLTGTRGDVVVTVTAVDCSGNSTSVTRTVVSVTCFCTYTQGGWGSNCRGGNPGCILDRNFDRVYPGDMSVGDHGSAYQIDLTSAAAVNGFLPQGTGTPGVLVQDYLNPLTTSAGVFGGQVTALKLTVDFDDAGIIPSISLTPIGNMVVASGPFAGTTVRSLLLLSEQVLGGDTSLLGGASVSDLNGAVDAVNRNFDNCSDSLGYLRRP